MKSRLERIKLLIDRYLSDIFGKIRVYREGYNFLIPWGFTVINVILFEEEGEIFIDINSPVALRVKPSKDLMKFLLSENANLKTCAFFTEFEEGYMDILVGIKLRYEDISRETLRYVLLNVGNVANEYGREIIAVFGGISFKEYVERTKAEYPFTGRKLFKEIVSVNEHNLIIEVYESNENNYTIICREEGKSVPVIKAQRKIENIYEVLNILNSLKEALEKRNLVKIKELFSILVKEKGLNKLKELEYEINKLPERLMKGEISYEEYKRRIREIEKEIGLS